MASRAHGDCLPARAPPSGAPKNTGVATRGSGGACGLANLGAKELKSYWYSVPGGQK